MKKGIKEGLTRVDVALATYNGGKFIQPLLDSLEKQTGVDVRIVASDDGSSDDTVMRLELMRDNVPLIIAPGEPKRNILRNFERAIVATDAPYVALCDQDDVWSPDKLEILVARLSALEAVHGTATPILVFCDLEIVDQNLVLLSRSFFSGTLKSPRARQFRDFVLGNHVPGCAMLVNRALLNRALPFPDVDIHDHWLIQVAALFGIVDHVELPLTKYRQHGENSIGIGAVGLGWVERLLSLVTVVPRQLMQRQRRWKKQALSIRRNLVALRQRYGRVIPSQGNSDLINVVLTGAPREIHQKLRDAITGERFFDYCGILRELYRLSHD